MADGVTVREKVVEVTKVAGAPFIVKLQFPVAVTVPSIFTDPPLQMVTSAVVIVAVGPATILPLELMLSPLTRLVDKKAMNKSMPSKIALRHLLTLIRRHMAVRVSRGVS